MDASLRELLDLFLRWLHLFAGILWVGNSMLFNWLDRNLIKRADQGERSFGTIWMLHSGAYYEVEKKLVAPDEFPKVLHWFKWQSYTTWLSGASLLVLVAYLGDPTYLVDPAVRAMSHVHAVSLSLAVLIGGWLLYDGLWRTLGKVNSALATALSLLAVGGLVFGLPQVFAARAAYLHVGALLGSVMSGNVFFHIIPSQKQMVAATLRGELADRALSVAAKTRSIHNNYMTFPVLWIMLSSHFPSTWGGEHRSVALLLLMVGLAAGRHVLNIRFSFAQWKPTLAAILTATVLGTGALVAPNALSPKAAPVASTPQSEQVAWPVVAAIVQSRCQPCHAEKPTVTTYASAAGGLRLDSPAAIAAKAERIQVRVIETKTMPMGNQTGITQEERDLLARWIAEGAHTE